VLIEKIIGVDFGLLLLDTRMNLAERSALKKLQAGNIPTSKVTNDNESSDDIIIIHIMTMTD
jgi:hypothetical protein